MKRDDIALVRFPHPSGARGKKRPAVIVQADDYNGRLRTVVVAEITKKSYNGQRPRLFVHRRG